MSEDTMLASVQGYLLDKGIIELERAIKEVSLYLYLHMNKYRLKIRDEDTLSDFFVWLFPKIGGIVQRYNPERSLFTTYLSMTIRLTYRNFCRMRYTDQARQKVYQTEEEARILSITAEQYNSGNWNDYLSELETHYSDEENSQNKKPKRKKSAKQKEIEARRLLLLACKNAHLLSDSQIEAIARMAGFSQEFLKSRIDLVRQTAALAQDRIRLNREKEYTYYLRSQKCLHEMKELEEGPLFEQIEKEYQYCLKRIADLRITISHQPASPSNRLLAKKLGFCRTVVDSALAREER